MTNIVKSIAGGVLVLAASGWGGWYWYNQNQESSDPTHVPTLLAQLAKAETTKDFRFSKNLDRAQALREQLTANDNPARKVKLTQALSRQLIYGGAVHEAIAELQQLIDWQTKNLPKGINYTKYLLALAYFRLGEITNCIDDHNADRCLFPIQGKGIYTQQLGANEAFESLLALLDSKQMGDSLKSRAIWLLNIAAMAIEKQQDPRALPWVIPSEQFASDTDIPGFKDIAESKNVAINGMAGGVILDDFNNDGQLDVLASDWGIAAPVAYRQADGNGTFIDTGAITPADGITGGLNITQADYDNDGLLDFFIPRGAWRWKGMKLPNSLVRNLGNGTFTDVTTTSGTLSFHSTQVAAWGDFNNDGHIDLFIGNEVRTKAVPWHKKLLARTEKNWELYQNNGDGTFTEVSDEFDIELNGVIKGAAWGDYNNDGWIDLYVSIFDGNNKLLKNLGKEDNKLGGFQDVTDAAGVAAPLKSFPVWFFDANNDGYEDIFVGGFAFKSDKESIIKDYMSDKGTSPELRTTLYLNNGNGGFFDHGKESGLDHPMAVMGANFGDIDNDGHLDMYLGTGAPAMDALEPNRMFLNKGDGRYLDVTTSGGVGHLQKGHAVAFADMDNDGDQDIYAVMGGAYPADTFVNALFENPGSDNDWITLRLEGKTSNRSAIGARIRVRVQTRDGVTRDIYRTVSSGGSFGASSLQQEIGLGKINHIEQILIQWPGGSNLKQTLKELAPNQVYRIIEGEEPVAVSSRLAAIPTPTTNDQPITSSLAQ